MVTHLRSKTSHTERQLKEQLLTNHPLARRRHQWKPARPGPRGPHTQPHEGSYCRNTVAPKAAGQHKTGRLRAQRSRPARGGKAHTPPRAAAQTPRPRSQTGSDSVTFLKEKSLLPEMHATGKGSVRCFWHLDLYYNDALKG